MSEFSKLNGYDVKDATARQSINTLEYSTIPEINNKLNRSVDNFKLNPIQNIIYDTSEYIQGCCSDGNYIYLYSNTTNVNGKLIKINPLTHQIVDTIQDIPLYHGNGLTYLNGKIYGACYYGSDGSTFTKNIAVIDMSNNTGTTINPLSSENITRLFGISKYDDNHILAVGYSDDSRSVNKTKWYKINITDYSYDELQFNLNGLPNNYSDTVIADIEKIDNKIYLLTSRRYIYQFSIDNNEVINGENIYDLGRYDDIGCTYGEFEGITAVDNENLEEHTMFISCVSSRSNGSSAETEYPKCVKGYLINPKTNLLHDYATNNSENANGYRTLIQVNDSNKNQSNRVLLENGTTTYPFTDLNRAILYNHNICKGQSSIIIGNSGNYSITWQYGKKAQIQFNGQTPTITLGNIQGCDFVFTSSSENYATIIGNYNLISVANCKLFFQYANFTSRIEASRGSVIKINRCKFNPSSSVTTGITLSEQSQYYGGMSEITNIGTQFLNIFQHGFANINDVENAKTNTVATNSTLIVQGSYTPES